jgi:Ca2+-transporting ATPase
MTVQQVFASGRSHTVTGAGYEPAGTVEDAGPVTGVLRAGALCCDARLLAPTGNEGWRVLGDTTEGAMLVAAAKAGLDLAAEAARTRRVGVFPFDPGRKLMTTIHQVGDGCEAYVKGAPQAVLERCSQAWWRGRVVPLEAALRSQIAGANDAMAGQALRVLAVAGKTVGSGRVTQDEAEHGLTFLGLVGMSDPPRPEVTAAVRACKRAGIATYMVTGDYGLTAEAVARRVGIIGDGPAQVVTGTDLDATGDQELAALLKARGQVIFARARRNTSCGSSPHCSSWERSSRSPAMAPTTPRRLSGPLSGWRWAEAAPMWRAPRR